MRLGAEQVVPHTEYYGIWRPPGNPISSGFVFLLNTFYGFMVYIFFAHNRIM